ncbi:MAG: sialic acid TRAP transporter substrate-binding protein SiaP [Rhodospirillales bacterium]|nr:sialic acid TRAP transporter substrate-binding protein SiaP [Rhodospirillales bacterium]
MKTGKFHLIAVSAIVAALSAIPASASDKITIKFTHLNSLESPMQKGAEKFKAALEEYSNGRFDVKIFPGGQLGNFRETMQQLTAGDIEMSLMTYGELGSFLPRANIGETVYILRDFNHSLAMINSKWGQELKAEIADKFNWRLLDSWYFGTRQLTSNKAVAKLADMKGLKLRVPQTQPLIEWSQAMGAVTTPIAFQEVYLALQTGVADAQENPLPTINAKKFYEVQKHISLTNHMIVTQNVVASDRFWKGLSHFDKQLIQAAVMAGGMEATNLVMDGEANLLAFFKEEGMEVHKPNLTPFMKAMEPVYEKNNKVWGAGVYEFITGLK